ncbi:hypothetical protein MMIC_P0554 [Mariprofundus micogutta]|uniref:ABC transporter domain-containing protein n=1 Tax=Mariprofundus micogutta TaxID=1921010 RepID=A0A1L8CL18_9PROT|nr:hypothetical protein [Mariprofundus micogutta]GAV19606.1 hypothetical protein MMIC_P0554 [Mariprofundus micogutta]
MSDVLHWDELHLGHTLIPASHVAHGEFVRLVMNYPCQYAFMQHMFSPCDESCADNWKMWLQTDSGLQMSGSREFSMSVGSMIRHRGLIANLSLRENLLLPFLYHENHTRLEQAADELVDVANLIGLTAALDEKAGERTTFTHALISLGRCLLIKPAIIVAQEVHIGMPPEHLEQFKDISMSALQRLGSGLLYLTASPEEGSGLDYARTLTVKAEHKDIQSRKGE